MSTTADPSTQHISESQLLRRLDVNGRRAARLKAAGVLVPDEIVGHVRLYKATRVAELAAKLAPPPAA